jgi:toxin ParE1/3/4
MAIKITYSQFANEDLYEIYKFIRRDSLFYAKKEVNDIRTVIKKLKLNTYRGKVFSDLDDKLTRELIFKNYRIIYEIIPDSEINIITIHHHARSMGNNPAFTDED